MKLSSEIKLSIIIPTFNEDKNVKLIYQKFESILKKNISWEMIFVDDNSSDKTDIKINEIILLDNRVKLLRRNFIKGLSSAIFDGINNSTGQYSLIIDADLQYKFDNLDKFLVHIIENQVDLIIATRFDKNFSQEWKKTFKYKLSKFGLFLAKIFISKNLPKDVLTGFFIINNNFFQKIKNKLHPIGFKALLEIFTVQKDIKFVEVDVEFNNRLYGESKMNFKIIFLFALQIIYSFLRKFIYK